MTPLPQLDNWETTRDSLHRAAKIFGQIRKILVKPQPNSLHLALTAIPQGVTTSILLPSGNEFILDFGEARVDYYSPANIEVFAVSLENSSPRQLMIDLMSQMRTVQFATISLTEPDDDEPFAIDRKQAAAYAQALYRVSTAIGRFRDKLSGAMTPLVVWPHNFDLSFLWFPGDDADENTQPHLSFGFAPYSDGFGQPYVYVYARPTPDGAKDVPLPVPARWNTKGFTGIVIDYADLLVEDEPEAMIVSALGEIYRVLSPLVGKS